MNIKYKKSLTFFMQLLVAIISFASAITSFYQFYSGNNLSSIIAAGITVLLLFVFVFVKIHSINTENEYKLKKTYEAMHKFSHLVRDKRYEILDYKQKGVINKELLRISLENFGQSIVDLISNTLKILTKNDMSVCIKCLDMKYWDNKNIDFNKSNVKTFTLCRCLNSEHHRKHNDLKQQTIKENTALEKIFVEGASEYCQINLKSTNFSRKSSAAKYKNSNAKWKEFYNNTIVVPIRIKRKVLEKDYKNDADRNLFAFICVDYKKSNAIDNNDISMYFDFLKVFADAMYIEFDEIYKCYCEAIQNEGVKGRR